jgi:hypothetical protein
MNNKYYDIFYYIMLKKTILNEYSLQNELKFIIKS